MFKSIYIRLALTNLKKNKRSYVPFLLTSIITIMMFFDMYMIMDNSGVREMPGADSMRSILGFGMVIVAIFAFIFLFYTNSFLIKQRRKEIGLYNVLGMGKKELSIMMFWESLTTGGISIVIGLIGGAIFGKLMFLLLYKIVGYETPLQYEISAGSVSSTVLLFVAITFITFAFNLLQVRKANPRKGAEDEDFTDTLWDCVHCHRLCTCEYRGKPDRGHQRLLCGGSSGYCGNVRSVCSRQYRLFKDAEKEEVVLL